MMKREHALMYIYELFLFFYITCEEKKHELYKLHNLEAKAQSNALLFFPEFEYLKFDH